MHFTESIEAILENNKINNAKWVDWTNAKHVQEVYGTLNEEHKEVAEAFLNCLIRNEGEYISQLVDAFSIIEYGILMKYPGLN